MDRPEVMTRADCLQQLARTNLGRVAFTERALPSIRAVSYAVVGNHLVLATDSADLGRRLDGQVVAFEVDQVDAWLGTGWSVVVTGTARLMRHPGELMRHHAAPLTSLPSGGQEGLVCIVPGMMTGRWMLSTIHRSRSLPAGLARSGAFQPEAPT